MNVSHELQRLRETGKLDTTIGTDNVGLILDMHNNEVKRKMDTEYEREINARNSYFYKLWQLAAEEIRSGRKPQAKKKEKKHIIHMAPEYKPTKLILPKEQGSGKIYLK